MPDKVQFKEGTFTCNCPDFTKSQTSIVRDVSGEREFTRSWADSDAGVDPAKGGMCKHIWAVILMLGQVGGKDVPLDPPVEIPPELKERDRRDRKRWDEQFYGDEFSPPGGFEGDMTKINPWPGA